jgi:[CysO sulfur-carrier protein]-S-L-cysteine hydrolase
MKLPKEFVDEMMAHALQDAPNECCGIIAGKDGSATKLFRAKNSEASPYRYNVDSNDLFRVNSEIDANEWSYLAIYHSHTASEADPSPTDIRLARYNPNPFYIIISLKKQEPVVRAFRIADGVVTENPIEIE